MGRNNTPQLVAVGNINPCRFVKLDTTEDNSAAEADANEVVIGISEEGTEAAPIPSQTTQYHASDGTPVGLYSSGDMCLLKAGSGGWAAGGRLKSDADGQGVAIATTGTTVQNIGAIGLEACAEGSLGRVQVRFESHRPALV